MKGSVAAHEDRPKTAVEDVEQHAAEFVHNYLLGTMSREGMASLGLVTEGALEGLRRFLVTYIGPEAAYSTMQRAADAVIEHRARPPPY